MYIQNHLSLVHVGDVFQDIPQIQNSSEYLIHSGWHSTATTNLGNTLPFGGCVWLSVSSEGLSYTTRRHLQLHPEVSSEAFQKRDRHLKIFKSIDGKPRIRRIHCIVESSLNLINMPCLFKNLKQSKRHTRELKVQQLHSLTSSLPQGINGISSMAGENHLRF